MTHYSKKRPRPCDEEYCELMPISKRINDLHLRSGCPDSNSSLDNRQRLQPQPPVEQEISMYRAQAQQVEAKTSSVVNSYNPELSATENPHYSQVNKFLNGVHLEWLQRSAKSNT